MQNWGQLSLAITIAIVGICVHLSARIWRPRRLFFVYLGREVDDAARRRSRRTILVNWAVCLAGMVGAFFARDAWSFILLSTVVPLLPIAWLLGEIVAVLRARPTSAMPGRFVVPLGSEERPSVLSYLSAPLQIAQIAVVLVTSTMFVWLLERMPAVVPLHWNARGEVDRYGSPAELWLFLPILIFDLALMWFSAWMVAKERWVLPPQQAERFAALQRQRRLYIVRLLEWIILGINLSMALMWLGMALGLSSGGDGFIGASIAVSLVVMALGIVAPLVAYLRPMMQVQDEIRAIAGTDALGTHPDGWVMGGLIYYAPDDPALFVPKRIGIGQTLNFGRPGAWIFIGAITVLPIVLTLVVIALAQ
ncbi:MAG: DUF1648 domain-containing protein [Deltaproteobacteria bacterium]|jgi:uncharacterized membrane protein|nr:DUF1648 domain-containing protein [Deltaproteobacteria bacterium]MBW2536645.1 DUF1648 domain-containing protein [Deltaproteobacteria bacterium]